MEQNAKNLIDNLFSRLQQAEAKSGPRDAAAEALIGEHLTRQPAAPYYMAQAMLVQEHALQNQQARLEALETKVRELEAELAERPAGGGFLAGLFGGGSKPAARERPSAQATPTAGDRPLGYPGSASGTQPLGYSGSAGYSAPAAAAFRPQAGGGFLGSALQTAAAVAGGVLIGNALSSLFSDAAQAAAEQVNVPLEPLERLAETLTTPDAGLVDAGLTEPAPDQDEFADLDGMDGFDDFGGGDDDFI
ncbi:MAG TPA: DUF2076 domain-containing protein [Candidatus Competibacteraceae bacterium]|nr:DUF2076 domain-containing protein [Candidatus Competibacteraceae bacterium]